MHRTKSGIEIGTMDEEGAVRDDRRRNGIGA